MIRHDQTNDILNETNTHNNEILNQIQFFQFDSSQTIIPRILNVKFTFFITAQRYIRIRPHNALN